MDGVRGGLIVGGADDVGEELRRWDLSGSSPSTLGRDVVAGGRESWWDRWPGRRL